MKAKRSRKQRTKKKVRKVRPYPFEFRLRVVRLYLEEEYPASLIREELGVSVESISTWVKCYPILFVFLCHN